MRIKLNKKIFLGLGLSGLLISPIFLTSCGSSSSVQQVVVPSISYDSSSILGGSNLLDDTISSLYKKYKEGIYYRDNNGLLTLDLSGCKKVTTIKEFAFGDFTQEINKLVLPPNLKEIHWAALYPSTTEGYSYAKQGINPMFKTIDKPNPKYNGDKYYFQLDTSKIRIPSILNNAGYYTDLGLPNQIYPISSFSFKNSDSNFDQFQPKDKSKNYISPPLPLNLLSETNYLKFYLSNDDVNSFKKTITFDSSKNRYNLSENSRQYLMSELYFPFGKANNPNAPSVFYNDPITKNNLMPTIVSNPYFFKYILYIICFNQLTRTYSDLKQSYVYTKSNNIFSNPENSLTLSFINEFTENKFYQEVINLSLDQNEILEILNYNFNSSSNSTSSISSSNLSLLKKWYSQYGMLDNWYAF